MLVDKNKLNKFYRVQNTMLKCGDILYSYREEILILTNEIAYFMIDRDMYYYDFDQEKHRLYFYFNNRYNGEIVQGLTIVSRQLKCH
jgi:hypothetical protein